jgi:hypothetical protein
VDYVRKVIRLPLEELCHPDGEARHRVRYLERDDIKTLLREAGRTPIIVVASLGHPLRWMTGNDAFDFWKIEASPRIGTPEGRNYLDDFPGEYFYFASEWCDESGSNRVIVLEHHH